MAGEVLMTDAEIAELRGRYTWPLQAWQGSHAQTVLKYAQLFRQTGEIEALGKTVAGLWTFVRNYQKGDFDGMEPAHRGDGVTKTFALRPRAFGNYGGGVNVIVAPTFTQPVSRGAGDLDAVGYYQTVLRVWDDSGDYRKGTDWAQSGDDPNNLLRWLPDGRRPAAGATYSVESSTYFAGSFTRLPPFDDAIIFAEPPAAGSVIYLGYCYSPPGGLPYQETLGGQGGFNLVYVDDSFVIKFLDEAFQAFLLVCDDPRFPADLRAAYLHYGPLWFDYARDHGYMKGSLQSNYGVGGESARLSIALAVEHTGHERGTAMVRECLDFWTANEWQMTGVGDPRPSMKGGFWPEGWNYGNLSVRKLMRMAVECERRGADVSGFRRWAAEVAAHLAHADPDDTRRTVYDGGDWFAYPVPFPREVEAALAALGIALPAPGTDYRAEGTGLVLSRAPGGVLVSVQAGPLLWCDHQQYTPGQVQIWAGGQPIVANGPVRLNDQSGAPKSKRGNCLLIDGNQNYPPGMGYWYDGRGFITGYEPGADVTRVRTQCGAAFSPAGAAGTGGPCEFWARDVWHFKAAGLVVVYDRVGVRGDYPWRVQWCTDTPNMAILGDVSGTESRTEGGVPFLMATGTGRRGRVVTVFGLDHRPAATLAGSTLTADGLEIALDPDWPPSLPDAPPPAPPPGPSPNPEPVPVPLPPPVLVLDARSYVPSDGGPTVLPDVYNGHGVLSFSPDQTINLGDALNGAPEFGFLILMRRVSGSPINKAILSCTGKLYVSFASWLNTGLWATFKTAAGDNNLGIGGSADPAEWHCYFGSYRLGTEGMIGVQDATAGSGNAPLGGALTDGSGGLVLNAGGSALEVVCLKVWDRGAASKADALAAVQAALAEYASAPPPPPPPPPPPVPTITEESRYASAFDETGRRMITIIERRN